MAELGDAEPVVTDDELDEDVGELEYSVEQFYRSAQAERVDLPPGLDGALKAIFEDLDDPDAEVAALREASGLIARYETELMANVYRWTGHFPERTRPLVRHLGERAKQLRLGYPAAREQSAVVALTTLVTALAMNHVHRGRYLP
jgi:hypothetical protein